MNIDTIAINPSIISPQEELEEIIREYITPDKLRKITGINNLDEVKSIELKVDSRKTSIGNVGKILPNLSQLKLNNSYFESIRNLGSSFDKLNILWACNCSINELDGISSFNSLKKLYVNKNMISDLYSISMLENLETLNIEGNLISKIEQLEYLALCPSLNNLTVRNNPIISKLKIVIEKNENISKQNKLLVYNQIIHDLVPSITILDGVPLDLNKKSILKDDEKKDIIKKADEMANDIINIKTTTSNSNKYYGVENEVEEASELTYGTTETVCGNPALFLRSRKQELQISNEKKKNEFDIIIKDYVDNEENENLSKINENNELINSEKKENYIKKEIKNSINNNLNKNKTIINNNKEINDNYIKEKKVSTKSISNKDIISNGDKKKKMKSKIMKKKVSKNSELDNNKEIYNSENVTENNDITSNRINNNNNNNNINEIEETKRYTFLDNDESEKIIKDKIKKSILNEYEKKKTLKSKHYRNPSSTTSISKPSSSSSNIVKLYHHHQSNSNGGNDSNSVYSIETIYSISSNDSSNSSNTNYGNKNKQNNNKSNDDDDDDTISNNKKVDITYKSLNDKNHIYSSSNKKNIYIKKPVIRNSRTGNTKSNEFNNISFLKSLQENNTLIPHPPLDPIPPQDNYHRPTSVPIIRRRMMYKSNIKTA
ncbi:hypothetical protein BCR32DRAFT_294901 [Anaeromyces robustus]|uniref:Outer arm dynein light chain 1 n=1 Tax=Anaeromyces robustus TaxID=1754192 RepID=A0A1Y1WYQ8_9FUNG|nr:hypothetical protein BCR32DRAFT_294901 [Anaeromyces robustus]|eukprot:ORX78691.1 hypothetical protein BCR32DRAFT_294901 [Anaeromyces robustus]